MKLKNVNRYVLHSELEDDTVIEYDYTTVSSTLDGCDDIAFVATNIASENFKGLFKNSDDKASEKPLGMLEYTNRVSFEINIEISKGIDFENIKTAPDLC